MTQVKHSVRGGGVGAFLKREFMELLPTAVFFLVGFNLITFTLHLALQEDGIIYDGAAKATIGALLVAKVVLVVDKMPAIRRWGGHPLIRPVLYRTLVYTAFVMLAEVLEGMIGKWIALGSLSGAISAVRADFIWQHFVATHIWVLVLFFVFIAAEEIRHIYGTPPFWKALFQRDTP